MATNPPKKHLTYSIRDFYKTYSKEAKNSDFEVRPYKEYKRFVYLFFKEVFKLMIFTGWHFVMPYSIGEMYLRNRKIKREDYLCLNKKKYEETGKREYYFVSKMKDRSLKLKFDRKFSHIVNIIYYKFTFNAGYKKESIDHQTGLKFLKEYIEDVQSDQSKNFPITYNRATGRLETPSYDFEKQ